MSEYLKSTLDVSILGKALAHSDDRAQSTFLNEFSRELKVGCKDKSLSGIQPCYISEHLDSNGIDLIKSLYEFIKLREDTTPITFDDKK